jgi:spore coat polysaccharide biosynthesis protein SpsF
MKNQDIGFITVRTSSTRLPSKCLLPFGEINVIEHVIRRAKFFNITPIICTSTDSSDDILEDIAKKEKILFFRGSLKNKLKRWSDCAEKFNVKCFHTVDADDPYFDGNEMKKSLGLLAQNNFDMVLPTDYSSNGSASVGYSISSAIIKQVVKNLEPEADTEMMWYFMEKFPGIKLAKLKDENKNYHLKMRLTLDYPEDYWLLCSIQRLIGNLASREQIEELFLRNPDFYKINWFRNEEWKAGQLSKKI